MTQPSQLSAMSPHESDVHLLGQVERALAGEGLEATIGPYRRRKLLAYDALSTTWSAWNVQTGKAAWVQVLRPRWWQRPSMVRRFSDVTSPAPLRGFTWLTGCDVPVRVLEEPGIPLRELVPVPGEDPVSLPLRAAVFAHGLQGLAALHGAERSVGGDIRDWLTVGAAGPRIVDRWPFASECTPEADIRDLARSIVDLAPASSDPIVTLARTWCERPPPSASDGTHLVARAMASHLAWLRHQLVRSRRHHTRGGRIGRLSRLVRRLEAVGLPPVGTACLAVRSDELPLMVWSDGEELRGGPASAPDPAQLPVVWSRAQGLDPVASRLLLRGWSAARETPEASEAIDRGSGATGGIPAEMVARWLKACRRLRSARLLLNAEAKVRMVPAAPRD
jgi:hypothetical protein